VKHFTAFRESDGTRRKGDTRCLVVFAVSSVLQFVALSHLATGMAFGV